MAEPPRGSRSLDRRAVLALLAVQFCFAVFAVLGKVAMRDVPPFVVAAIRAVSGAVLLTLAARLLAPGAPPFDRRDHAELAGLSILGIVANQTLFINGLARTTATNTTLLASTAPVFTLLLVFLFRVEKPSLRRVLGIPVALGGVLFLLDLRNVRLGDATLVGNLLVALNSLCYAGFLVASRPILARRPAIVVTAGIFRWGAAPVLLLALPELADFRPAAVRPSAWWAIAGIVVFSTLLAYTLIAWALSRTTPSTAAVFIYVQPLVAISLARAVLGERLSSQTAVAAALIFTGVALTTWPQPLRGRRPLPR